MRGIAGLVAVVLVLLTGWTTPAYAILPDNDQPAALDPDSSSADQSPLPGNSSYPSCTLTHSAWVRDKGEWYDAGINQSYMRNRQYELAFGRFAQVDPARDGRNWYAFCGGDPINRSDPSGLRWLVHKGDYDAFKASISSTFSGMFTQPMFPEDILPHETGGPGTEQGSIFTKIDPQGGESGDLIEIGINESAVGSITESVKTHGFSDYQALLFDQILSNDANVWKSDGFSAITAADSGNIFSRAFSSSGGGTKTIAGIGDFLGPLFGRLGALGEFEIQATGGLPGASGIGGILKEAGAFSRWASAFRLASIGAGVGDRLAPALRGARITARVPHQIGNIADLGETDMLGNITIKQGLVGRVFTETLRHESVHRWLSPLYGPMSLRQLRGRLKWWGYSNSNLLRYGEEALAETYGTGSLTKGIAFPLSGYSVSIQGALLEAAGYGTAVGGATYGAYKLGQGLAGTPATSTPIPSGDNQ